MEALTTTKIDTCSSNNTHPLASTHPQPRVEQQLAQRYEQPIILIKGDTIRAKAARFRTALPRVTPHFAVKSNPDPRVLRLLKNQGIKFEIASKEELDSLLALGVPAAEIFYSNPIKSRVYLAHAAQCGVEWYVADSVEELEKIHNIKTDAKVYLRLHTPNDGSHFPLSAKFGAYPDDVDQIINRAGQLGIDLAGVTFHVGSQCTNLDNWRSGIRCARQVFDQMIAAGHQPRLLNLGGGYPVDLSMPAPSIETIAEVINRELEAFPPEVAVIAEPGRYLVADAGIFICQVIGTTQRQGKNWLYLDAGFYGGLIELKDGLDFVIHTNREGPLVPWTLAGPTCDSADICTDRQRLPADLRAGDYLYIQNAGAYSSACACRFNGFPLPEVVVV